nr:transposase [Okeania sp. SIO2F4]
MRRSKRAGEWYISFKYEQQPQQTTKERDIIGVDVGINLSATCSDGTVFANVKAYKQGKKRLTGYQRRVSKKEPGFLRNATQTKNRAKAVKRLAKAHKKADATPRRRQIACGTRTKQ